MTILTGNLQSVSGTPFGGPGCNVVIYSRLTRPGFAVDGLVLELQDRIRMPVSAGGRFQTEDLDPGPIRVELEGGTVHGRGWDIDLPETGTHSLANLIDAQVEWSPAIVGRAEAAAALAGDEADRASGFAIRAESAATLLESALTSAADLIRVEVAADADRAEHARERAETAQAAAETAQGAAESAAQTAAGQVRTELQAEATRAETAATQAAEGATTAGTYASASADSARTAGTYAAAAADSASSADAYTSAAAGSAEQAGLSAEAASGSASSAAVSASDAAGSATAADAHRQAAAGYETGAQTAQTAAEAARDAAQTAADNANTGAPAEGWAKTDLAVPVQESLSRADTALQSVPDATPDARGVIRLAGDLGGTATSPTVPGLAGKAPAEHKHVSADVTDAVDSTTASTGNAGKLVKLDATGRVRAATPTTSAHVATKGYIDQGLAGKADSGHTHSQYATAASVSTLSGRVTALEGAPARPPTTIPWSGQGTWVAPPGATTEDAVLNLATGEVHSITEVS